MFIDHSNSEHCLQSQEINNRYKITILHTTYDSYDKMSEKIIESTIVFYIHLHTLQVEDEKFVQICGKSLT